jgi:hypothetical protein
MRRIIRVMRRGYVDGFPETSPCTFPEIRKSTCESEPPPDVPGDGTVIVRA